MRNATSVLDLRVVDDEAFVFSIDEEIAVRASMLADIEAALVARLHQQISVDGGSVVDNVVGTTVQNFSQEIIQEFQIGLSNFSLSTGASASGSTPPLVGTLTLSSASGTPGAVVLLRGHVPGRQVDFQHRLRGTFREERIAPEVTEAALPPDVTQEVLLRLWRHHAA